MKTMDKKPAARPRKFRHGLPGIARSQPLNAQRLQIGRILRNNNLQAKLTIGQPNDKYKKEADRVADKFMGMPEQQTQRQEETEEEVLQTKPIAVQITPRLQRQAKSDDGEEKASRPLLAHPIKYRLSYNQEKDRYEDLASTKIFTGAEMARHVEDAKRFATHQCAVARILARRITELDRVDAELAGYTRRGIPAPVKLMERRKKDALQIVKEAHYEAAGKSSWLVIAGYMDPVAGCKVIVEPQENPLLEYPMWVHERTHELHCQAIVGQIRERHRRNIEFQRARREVYGQPPMPMADTPEWRLYLEANTEITKKRVVLESEKYAYRAGAKAAEEEVRSFKAGETLYAPGVPVSFEEKIEVPAVRRVPTSQNDAINKAKPERVVREVVTHGDGGHSLPLQQQKFVESALGHDLSEVRIHRDPGAWQAADRLNARAFTIGRDIYFGKGEYAPQTETGKRLLAHELVHVVQQGGQARRLQNSLEVSRKVRPGNVSCEGYPDSHSVIKKIGTREPLGEIETAADRSVELLDDAIAAMSSARKEYRELLAKKKPISEASEEASAVASILYQVFDLEPSAGVVLKYLWQGDGPGTVHVMIRRLKAVRKILKGGEMAYVCLGKLCVKKLIELDLPETKSRERRGCVDPRAYVTGPQYQIFLCEPWWSASGDAQASTLIHEALHIYYWPLMMDYSPPLLNPYYYQDLIRRLAGTGL